MHLAHKGQRIRDIVDGTSKTAIVSEYIRNEIDPHKLNYPSYCPNQECFFGKFWAAANLITSGWGINQETTYLKSNIASAHPSGANFLYADGHVAFLPHDTAQEILDAVTTRAGGD